MARGSALPAFPLRGRRVGQSSQPLQPAGPSSLALILAAAQPQPQPLCHGPRRRACSCSAGATLLLSPIHPATHSLRGPWQAAARPHPSQAAGTPCGNLFMAECVREWGRGSKVGTLLLERVLSSPRHIAPGSPLRDWSPGWGTVLGTSPALSPLMPPCRRAR